jgi:hypothetical protein
VVVLEGEMASVSPAREGFAVSARFSRERKQELRGKANGEPEGSPFVVDVSAEAQKVNLAVSWMLRGLLENTWDGS